ncbi:MAG TPA: DUF3011 domain-containing protein [Dyella sp.]|uniref:DUF3011 domain-containing protein n=1 Tax=Dyella sp. TaxID=1869338 RepID=UPI002F946619
MNTLAGITFTAASVLAGFAGMGLSYDAEAQRYRDDDRDGYRDDVYCASNDGRDARCRTPWRDSEMAQQMSRASCIRGRTWGNDRYGVWVTDGCRATFREARRGGGRPDYAPARPSPVEGPDYVYARPDIAYRPGYNDGPGREVYCASNDSRGSRCQMPWRYSELSRQMSKSPCIYNQTWGSDPHSVWVKQGCRGQFVEARGR